MVKPGRLLPCPRLEWCCLHGELHTEGLQCHFSATVTEETDADNLKGGKISFGSQEQSVQFVVMPRVAVQVYHWGPGHRGSDPGSGFKHHTLGSLPPFKRPESPHVVLSARD